MDRNPIAREDTYNRQSGDIFKIFSEDESQNEKVMCCLGLPSGSKLSTWEARSPLTTKTRGPYCGAMSNSQLLGAPLRYPHLSVSALSFTHLAKTSCNPLTLPAWATSGRQSIPQTHYPPCEVVFRWLVLNLPFSEAATFQDPRSKSALILPTPLIVSSFPPTSFCLASSPSAFFFSSSAFTSTKPAQLRNCPTTTGDQGELYMQPSTKSSTAFKHCKV